MKLFVCLTLLLCVSASLAATTGVDKVAKSADSAPAKPKREAPLSSGKGGYHGPSYKYLPPSLGASTSGGGYDSYSHASSAGVGASGGGYDFGSSGSVVLGHHASGGASSYHGGVGGSYHGAGGAAGFGASASGPSVETYIIQTAQNADQHQGQGYEHGTDGGYKYSGPAIGGGAGAGSSFFGGGFSGHGQGQQSQHGGHKVQTFVVPASHGFGGSSHGGSGGYSYNKGIGGSSSSGGIGHGQHSFGGGLGGGSSSSSAFGHSSHLGSVSSYAGPYAVGHSTGGSSQGGYNYAPSTGSIGGFSAGHGHGHGNDYHSASSASFGGASSFGGSKHTGSSSGSFGGSVQGYSYDAPAVAAQSVHHIPSTNYGVPSNGHTGGYSTNGHASSSHGYASSSSSSAARETPAYAVGHKGLGHFGYTASKPHVLHTNIIDSSSYSHSQPALSKAPFKPSTFLGSSQESSTNYHSSAPSSEYLPPTSAGYEYQSPSVLYGSPSQQQQQQQHGYSGEPSSAYLPALPSGSYVAPHH